MGVCRHVLLHRNVGHSFFSYKNPTFQYSPFPHRLKSWFIPAVVEFVFVWLCQEVHSCEINCLLFRGHATIGNFPLESAGRLWVWSFETLLCLHVQMVWFLLTTQPSGYELLSHSLYSNTCQMDVTCRCTTNTCTLVTWLIRIEWILTSERKRPCVFPSFALHDAHPPFTIHSMLATVPGLLSLRLSWIAYLFPPFISWPGLLAPNLTKLKPATSRNMCEAFWKWCLIILWIIYFYKDWLSALLKNIAEVWEFIYRSHFV